MKAKKLTPKEMELLEEEVVETPEEAKEETKEEVTETETEDEAPVRFFNNLTKDDLHKAKGRLRTYKDNKKDLEWRIRANEEWWRLRHWAITQDLKTREEKNMAEPVSAWLHNSINNKHADIMDNYPEPMVLPREESDDPAARVLTSILPVVLEYNKYEQVYSDAGWYKLKQGCSAKIVGWNSKKNNGLGDIDIRRVDLLNLFWEPGISDIQESRDIFHVQLVNNDILESEYPDLLKESNEVGNKEIDLTKYVAEDGIDTSDKTAVIDWYYKQFNGTREVLHYCKFVGDTILYASENDPEYAERGFYDHGKYPFVFDKLFVEEGSPAGFGYIDIMKDPQMYIDKMQQTILETSIKAGKQRYFMSDAANVNEEEFNDYSKNIIHVAGTIDDRHIAPLNQIQVSGAVQNILSFKIDELKETSGNRDFSQGSTQSGVTAATAIAALQEAGSKLSRDMIRGTYRAFQEECELVIELIRQFYDEPRQFRILGKQGEQEFTEFSNRDIKPQEQEDAFGVEIGSRIPVFDVTVSAAKKSTYSRMSQNELALQFYDKGFFAPGNADASIACLDMMEFEGKEKIIKKIEDNGTLLQQLQMMQEQLAQLQAAVGLAPQMQGVNPGDMRNHRGSGDMSTDNLGGATPRSERLEGAKAQAKGMAEV